MPKGELRFVLRHDRHPVFWIANLWYDGTISVAAFSTFFYTAAVVTTAETDLRTHFRFGIYHRAELLMLLPIAYRRYLIR